MSLLASAAALLGGCQVSAESRAAAAPFEVSDARISVSEPGFVRFDTATAERAAALPLPVVPARVSAVEALTSPSFAPLAGRVVEVKVRLGEQVEKGQRLVLVRTADLPVLDHEVRAAELAVTTRTASVERFKQLVAARAGTENDLMLAQSELEEARLALKAAKSRLASLQVSPANDNTYWVLANRKGTLIQLDAAPGREVGPEHGAPLATVADLSEVVVVGDVRQGDASELEVGERARVLLAESEAVEGSVEVISEIVDPERQTVPVRVRVANGARKLRPNAFVYLRFDHGAGRMATLVPASAVVRDGASAVVFVESEPGVYAKRRVELGRLGREHVEVVAGLEAGERVVKSGTLLLLNAIDIEA